MAKRQHKTPAKAPASAAPRFTLTLKKGAAFRRVGIADFTLVEGETREVSEEVARSVEHLFRAGVLPDQLRTHLIVEGLDGD